MRLLATIRERFHARTHRRGLDGHAYVDKQRRHALLMVRTAQVRVAIWATLMIAGPFSHTLSRTYSATTFVTYLSLGALLLTDWGQYAASSAELAAGDAHHDAEAARVAIGVDFHQLDGDIARLAALQPGPDAQKLAADIRGRLGVS
jgi:hypothetical protein